MAKKENTEEKKDSVETLVVNELPNLPTREATGNDGNNYSLITTTEAINEIRKDVKEIKEALTG